MISIPDVLVAGLPGYSWVNMKLFLNFGLVEVETHSIVVSAGSKVKREFVVGDLGVILFKEGSIIESSPVVSYRFGGVADTDGRIRVNLNNRLHYLHGLLNRRFDFL